MFALKPSAKPVLDEEKTIDGEEADPNGPDVFDEGDDEPDEEEQKGRHHFLILYFLFVRNETDDRIQQLTSLLADERITVNEWAHEFRQELTSRHAEAASIGRRLAGDMAPHSAADQAAGAEAWARQEPFFRNFVEDLNNDRYNDGQGALLERQVNARARQYGSATRGTAHEAFRIEMADDALGWKLGAADHCHQQEDFPYNCPDLSKEEPKPASEWPTSPGLSDTPCRINCACFFESVDGKYSTEGI